MFLTYCSYYKNFSTKHHTTMSYTNFKRKHVFLTIRVILHYSGNSSNSVSNPFYLPAGFLFSCESNWDKLIYCALDSWKKSLAIRIMKYQWNIQFIKIYGIKIDRNEWYNARNPIRIDNYTNWFLNSIPEKLIW